MLRTVLAQATCDTSQALVPAENGSGCSLRVLVTIADQWQAVGLIMAAAVLIALYGSLVAQLARR